MKWYTKNQVHNNRLIVQLFKTEMQLTLSTTFETVYRANELSSILRGLQAFFISTRVPQY